MRSVWLVAIGVFVGIGAYAWADSPPETVSYSGHVDTADTYEIAAGKALVRMIHTGGSYIGVIEGRPGLSVPEHRHAGSNELLYVLEGTGWMTVDGRRTAVRAGMGIQIPADTPHSFEVPADAQHNFKAVQVYSVAGPEARFRNGRALAPGQPWSPSGFGTR
jgi:quercetin dioxygenase-like cupin family protein